MSCATICHANAMSCLPIPSNEGALQLHSAPTPQSQGFFHIINRYCNCVGSLGDNDPKVFSDNKFENPLPLFLKKLGSELKYQAVTFRNYMVSCSPHPQCSPVHLPFVSATADPSHLSPSSPIKFVGEPFH